MTDDSPAAPGGGEEAKDTAQTGIDTTVPHSARIWNYWLGGKAEIASFFEGLELVEPGVVSCPQWRPEQDADTAELDAFGGVGRKP